MGILPNEVEDTAPTSILVLHPCMDTTAPRKPFPLIMSTSFLVIGVSRIMPISFSVVCLNDLVSDNYTRQRVQASGQELTRNGIVSFPFPLDSESTQRAELAESWIPSHRTVNERDAR